jgi:hypothetical protein
MGDRESERIGAVADDEGVLSTRLITEVYPQLVSGDETKSRQNIRRLGFDESLFTSL